MPVLYGIPTLNLTSTRYKWFNGGLRDISPTDNVTHLMLVTCYNILNGVASKIDEEMHALLWCIKSPMTSLQSVKVTDFHHPWDTPETCTLDHIRSDYVEHNKERLLFPSNHCWLEPPTLDINTDSSHSGLPLPHLILKFTSCFVHIF
jgi:hypothetical protein